MDLDLITHKDAQPQMIDQPQQVWAALCKFLTTVKSFLVLGLISTHSSSTRWPCGQVRSRALPPAPPRDLEHLPCAVVQGWMGALPFPETPAG